MKTDQSKSVAASVGGFIERYRIAIISVLVIVIVSLIAIFVISTVTNNINENGLEILDSLSVELSTARSQDEVDSTVIDDILTRAKELADSSNGIVATRAYMFSADIDFSNQNWEYSKESWLNAAKESNAYTSPICYYNAAVCAEEMGDMDSAIENYSLAVEDESFALASRALFNMGRIEEQRGNFSVAAEDYNKLFDTYSGNAWANLAKSRIISLKAEGKIAY